MVSSIWTPPYILPGNWGPWRSGTRTGVSAQLSSSEPFGDKCGLVVQPNNSSDAWGIKVYRSHIGLNTLVHHITCGHLLNVPQCISQVGLPPSTLWDSWFMSKQTKTDKRNVPNKWHCTKRQFNHIRLNSYSPCGINPKKVKLVTLCCESYENKYSW